MNHARPTFTEAIRLVSDASSVGGTEYVPIVEANDRVLASPVTALRSCPAFDMAAMDGYAIALADIGCDAETILQLGEPRYAGSSPKPMTPGKTHWIATGASVPPGAGAILMKENARLSGSALYLSGKLPEGANIRRAGEDAHADESVMEAGERLHPATIGALCAYGVQQIEVRRRPRVALVSLGDELTSGAEAGPYSVIDANGPMIAALLRDARCELMHNPLLGDDLQEISRGLAALSENGADIILTTGGASVGDRDLLRPAAESLGAIIHFHGVHMRPGKPALFASLPSGTLLIGLPGNPVAALVATRFFVCRALRAWLGAGPEQPRIWIGDEVRDGPTRVLKVRADQLHDRIAIDILPGQQSHILRPLLRANGWLVSGGGERQQLFSLYDGLLRPSF